MNSNSLDALARQRLERNIRAQLSYLDKLTGRMHQKHFPIDDPLRIAGEAARVTVQRLYDVAKKLHEEAMQRK